MTHRMADVLRALDEFQVHIGFENFTEDEVDSIYDVEDPFVIKKSEWRRALVHCRNMSKRGVDDWWNDFVNLGYLHPIDSESKSKKYKDEEAWFQVGILKRDIDAFHGGMEKYLEEN